MQITTKQNLRFCCGRGPRFFLRKKFLAISLREISLKRNAFSHRAKITSCDHEVSENVPFSVRFACETRFASRRSGAVPCTGLKAFYALSRSSATFGPHCGVPLNAVASKSRVRATTNLVRVCRLHRQKSYAF